MVSEFVIGQTQTTPHKKLRQQKKSRAREKSRARGKKVCARMKKGCIPNMMLYAHVCGTYRAPLALPSTKYGGSSHQ